MPLRIRWFPELAKNCHFFHQQFSSGEIA